MGQEETKKAAAAGKGESGLAGEGDDTAHFGKRRNGACGAAGAVSYTHLDAAVFGEAAEEGLLLFDAQNGNPVLFPVAAGEEKAPDGVVPAQGGVLHEALRIGHDFGLLEIENFHNQILFGREKGVKKAARDADGFINLPDVYKRQLFRRLIFARNKGIFIKMSLF